MENFDTLTIILIGIIATLFIIIIFLLFFALPQNYQQGYNVGYRAGNKEIEEKFGECEKQYLICKDNSRDLNESLSVCKTDLENCTAKVIYNFSQYRINLFNRIINLQKFVSIFFLGFGLTIILSLFNIKIESRYFNLLLLILIILLVLYLFVF